MLLRLRCQVEIAKQEIRGQKVLSKDGQEVRLYCYSPARSLKEEAMAKRFCELYEAALDAIADGLSRPRNEKRYLL